MANADITRFGKNNQKKNVSLASAKLYPAKLDHTYGLAVDGTIAIGDVLTLFQLPTESVITDCFVVVRTAPTGDGQQTTIKLSADAVDIMDAVALGANVGIVGSLKAKTYIKAGAVITATLGTKALKDGVFELVVEFQEIDRVNGDYLN